MTPNNIPNPRHQAAMRYTEEQSRLLLVLRDMVKQEVKRQLKKFFKKHIYF